MSNVPFEYEYINTVNASYSPSEVHLQNNRTFLFFRRFLLQRVIGRFGFKLPKWWSRDYFLYVLYGYGYMAVVNTDKFGVIPQWCGLQGFDVFYRPTRAIISNPLLTGILNPKIGEECEIIKMQPDYGSVMSIVNFYAEKMALTAMTATVNIENSKLAYVFAAANKGFAEAFKKMVDDLQAGLPAVFLDKELFNEDGSKNWLEFTQNLAQNYIAGDLLQDLRKWELQFDTMIGINNANTEKKERLITAEVDANNEEVHALSDLWFDTISEGIEKTREMFGLDPEELAIYNKEKETEAIEIDDIEE